MFTGVLIDNDFFRKLSRYKVAYYTKGQVFVGIVNIENENNPKVMCKCTEGVVRSLSYTEFTNFVL